MKLKLMPIPGRKRADGGRENKLVAAFHPKFPITESYRILRTNIQFLSIDNPVKTMVFTSAGPQEGKTLTTANLGVTMAQAGSRVVLVDCDLRRPALHKPFQMNNLKGLTNILLGESSIEAVLQTTGVGNLSLIASGPLPPNPAELLNSRRMATFIERLKESYDYVLFDSPPALAVADAAILASQVDGAVMVINAGEVAPQAALKAKAILDNAKARILGVVLSNIAVSGEDSYYYYYYGKHGA